MFSRSITFLTLLLTALLLATVSGSGTDEGGAPLLEYRVLKKLPHDPDAFTQGLAFKDSLLWESTGRRGRSTLRRVDPATGEVLASVDLDPELFGEGIALLDDRILQLTWTSHRGLVYERSSLELVGEFSYAGQGWGLTYDIDADRLIMSDGSADLRFLDPHAYGETGRIRVMDEKYVITRLNELEYACGSVFANVWPTDRIARIDPASGRVTGWLDFSRLRIELGGRGEMLNGIAHDDATGRFYVTGKDWPAIYLIELIQD